MTGTAPAQHRRPTSNSGNDTCWLTQPLSAITGLSPQRSGGGERSGRLRTQLVEQRLCLLEIGSIEAFGEPAVDRREQIAGFGAAALVAAEPGEAHGGTQLPEFGLLLSGDPQGFAIEFLGGL